MTEHEMLKEICDEIGYDTKKWSNYENCFIKMKEIPIDVREIIFTNELMKAIFDYCDNTPWTWIMECDVRMLNINLMENLDNPTKYLYHLIKPND